MNFCCLNKGLDYTSLTTLGIIEARASPCIERERESHSRTTRLSLGDRPVLAPERVARAPLDVMKEPCSYLIACSYSSAFVDCRTRPRNRAS